MNTLTYVFDPKKLMLIVYDEDKKCLGGYIGQIAERKFEKLLMTDAFITLGSFLTEREKQANQSNKSF
jgi:hypothetical protein